MDHQFPLQLFPSFYNHGPPDLRQKYCPDGWGSYERLIPQEGAGPRSSWTFTSRHQVSGETWRHTEPVPIPLLSPRSAFLPSVTPPDPTDFLEHMQNFFTDHSHDAFGSMSRILGKSFDFTKQRGEKPQGQQWESANMSKMKNFLDKLKFGVCQRCYHNRTVTRYCNLLSDVVHDIPPQLLGSLLHEELAGQRDRMLFFEAAIGGALAFVPFSQSHGCLLYPGGRGLDCLNFHGVALQYQPGSSFCVDTSSRKPLSFQLNAPIRQISCSSLFSCVGVRSDHLCGVWRFSERSEPFLLQVVNTSEVSTCINVSPHVLGEVLVASESGAADLWTVGKGFQKVRVEDSNLYFNAKSPWRWCEFSAHPRVMLYADRTGAELTDMRVAPSADSSLFRISSTSECRKGERLILSKYLGDVHPFHHLVTTQYSAYILDERFPCVPMLKWDHMMASPPVFCHVAPSCHSAGTAARTTKVLLGSHSSQEMVLLQYLGGRAEASVSRGPHQALLTPRESLKHLPVQIPHRLNTATNRLSAPAAGLTCILKRAGEGPEEHMYVLQLTEAGDIFCQTLELKLLDSSTSEAPAAESSSQEAASSPPRTQTAAQQPATLLGSDSCSDEDAIGPTQATASAVPETPERKQGSKKHSSDSSSEGSEDESRRRKLKRLQLEIFCNDEPEMNEDRPVEGDEEHRSEDGGEASSSTPPQQQNLAKLSNRTLMTWKLWLQKLMRRSCENKPCPYWPELLITQTKGLLHLPESGSGETSEEQLASLQQKLQSCMHGRSLLLHSAVSEDLTVLSVPELVNTDDWTDPLSQRLTLSWQGESAWTAWWEEELGLNRDAKMQSLRRKRRRQKEARRAAGQQWKLSQSFTSSCSSQSQLDDFSDSASCSSTLRQWSDTDDPGGLSWLAQCIQHENQGGSSPSICEAGAPLPTPATTSQRRKDPQSSLQIPDQSQTPSLSQMRSSEVIPANQRRTKRPNEDYLNSLFPIQGDPFEDAEDEPPSLSQPRSSLSASLRSTRPAPTRSPFSSMTSSQLLSPSQGSQRQMRLSQASQPKKKRSQMGF